MSTSCNEPITIDIMMSMVIGSLQLVLMQKVAHVITSWISTDMQNLVTILQGVSFPRMREIAHQNVYSASFFRLTNIYCLPTLLCQ